MSVVSRLSRGLVTVAVAFTLLAVTVSVASAFGPRVPQIGFNNAALQAYLNVNDGGINTLVDQVNGQVWTTGASGNASFTLMIELTATAAANAIGIYNTSGPPVPPLFQVFPGAATAGWFAQVHFGGGNLVVTLFDNNAIIQGQTFYAGVNANAFGFYIQGPGGTFFSQDTRNPGGAAQILTYLGTGNNFGEWWECFEDTQYAQGDQDFDDAVLILESVVPTPVDGTSWGKIKSIYRK